MYGLTYSTNSRISSQQTRTARRGSPAHAAPASCQLRLALRAHSKHAQGADMDQSCVGVRHRRDRRPRDLHPPGSLQLHAASPPPPTLCEAPSVLRTELTSEDAMPACLTGFTALRASSLKSGKVWSPSLSAPRQPGIPAYPAAHSMRGSAPCVFTYGSPLPLLPSSHPSTRKLYAAARAHSMAATGPWRRPDGSAL